MISDVDAVIQGDDSEPLRNRASNFVMVLLVIGWTLASLQFGWIVRELQNHKQYKCSTQYLSLVERLTICEVRQ